MTQLTPEQIHEEVQTRYGRIADEFKLDVSASCCGETVDNTCCGAEDAEYEALFSNLYQSDTSWLPDDVTALSLGCGDPITLAGLQAGQTVLDLGAGGGIDCFMAARQVGPSGYVIGVDMTPSMIEKANRNKEKVGLSNVEFRRGFIENMPVDDDSVDVIISNCVINLSPDKTAVFREAFRVLKPGGRIAVSDMVTQGNFTPQQRADMAAWTGCITGAEDVADYVAAIRAAGFGQISVRDKATPDAELVDVPRYEGEVKVFSARVTAVKPEK
ncbi:MAG: arsenite methyltransferase [Ardenticatenaceae bacterium]|nr:arsenite methyltransferase [Anaerolineales bacterium]MCB8921113.1 arsenite methyltransferase [Ardenticatenaceae bacterium]MCB8990818.1 arsenite methyltransferase [Ardenticatenaceae bacterium]MCB9004488.1 arsenite methyltransferase [Ardenticatenaceae bacterium]